MAVSLSQTEMKALNRCPNTAPAVLPATQHNYHTDCCLDGSSSHCCPVRFLLKALLSEILEDNIAVILRIKERRKSFPLSPHRLKDSLCSAAFRFICSVIRFRVYVEHRFWPLLQLFSYSCILC